MTGIHVSCVAALRKHYGLPEHPVSVIEPYQMLGAVEPDLRDALGIDTVSVLPKKNLFGFSNDVPIKEAANIVPGYAINEVAVTVLLPKAALNIDAVGLTLEFEQSAECFGHAPNKWVCSYSHPPIQ